MSYSLGQAKWIPGQIHFATTRTGRLPSVQKLREADLPYAPYIEHGSFVTGQPDIARYGRDPYRGISGPVGYLGQLPDPQIERRAEETQQAVTETAQETIRAVVRPVVMITFGTAVGAAAGAVGGFMGKTFWGGVVGAAGGGVLGYLAFKQTQERVG